MKNGSAPKTFHLWFPNIFEFKGGIQVYSDFLLKALICLLPQSHYRIFIKHDTQPSSEFSELNNLCFYFAGAVPLFFRTWFFAAQIVWYCFWQPPHLIIATHLNFTVASYWLKRWLGIPYWGIAHGVEAWNIERPALKKALHHADRILAVSHYTRDRLLQEQNLDPAKISLLPNTFDSSRFTISPKPQKLLRRYQLSADLPIILTVARLDKKEQYKGYDRIIKSLPKIRARLPDIRYILVGQGNDRPRIEKLIEQLNLQDCVTLAGFISDDELVDHYNLCDVFAMPSQGEGFGIVYLEALACGKPVLGGNQDGAIDALCNGELGALVDPNDVESIATTLIQILQGTYSNPILYQPETLRQKVIEFYGFESYKKALWTLLERQLEGEEND